MKTTRSKKKPGFIPLWPDYGKRLGLSKHPTYQAAERGEIPAIRIGRLWRVPEEAGEEFLRTGINRLRGDRAC